MIKRLCCITGGYGRLGKDMAKAFVAGDFDVLITGRDAEKLEEAAGEIGCDHYMFDVTKEEQGEQLKTYIRGKYNKLDVLINNAGIMRSRPVPRMNPSLFLSVLKTNLYGPFLSAHIMFPLLKKSKNAMIINICSTSAHRADAGMSAYSASKFGLLGFTESLRKEMRQYNIRVSSISPSSIEFDDGPLSGKGIALKGKDVAEAAVFLANSHGRALYRDLEIWATNP